MKNPDTKERERHAHVVWRPLLSHGTNILQNFSVLIPQAKLSEQIERPEKNSRKYIPNNDRGLF